jgi:type IV secretory pathway VirB2 component (pilin)
MLLRKINLFVMAIFALVAGSAASAQWTPTFDGVSAASIQAMFQSVLTSYQGYITALLVVIGLIVGAGVILSLLQKRSPVKM